MFFEIRKLKYFEALDRNIKYHFGLAQIMLQNYDSVLGRLKLRGIDGRAPPRMEPAT